MVNVWNVKITPPKVHKQKELLTNLIWFQIYSQNKINMQIVALGSKGLKPTLSECLSSGIPNEGKKIENIWKVNCNL